MDLNSSDVEIFSGRSMAESENILDLIIDNFKKLFYPQEWIALDLEFSKSELFTLLFLAKQGEVMMSQIADYINVPMSTANGIVERLVKKGYVNRDRSETDRRIVVVGLTETGRGLVDNLKNTIFEYIRLIDAELDEEERRLILKIFGKIVTVLNQKITPDQTETVKAQVKKIPIE